MSDEHLNEPPDDALPSTGLGMGVGMVLLLGLAGAVGLASSLRTAEADDSRAARSEDATALTEAPMARYPGGIDARALDANRAINQGSPPAAGPPAPPPAAGPPRRGGPPPAKTSKGPPPPRPREHR